MRVLLRGAVAAAVLLCTTACEDPEPRAAQCARLTQAIARGDELARAAPAEAATWRSVANLHAKVAVKDRELVRLRDAHRDLSTQTADVLEELEAMRRALAESDGGAVGTPTLTPGSSPQRLALDEQLQSLCRPDAPQR